MKWFMLMVVTFMATVLWEIKGALREIRWDLQRLVKHRPISSSSSSSRQEPRVSVEEDS